jgi:hypothetical protein
MNCHTNRGMPSVLLGEELILFFKMILFINIIIFVDGGINRHALIRRKQAYFNQA